MTKLVATLEHYTVTTIHCLIYIVLRHSGGAKLMLVDQKKKKETAATVYKVWIYRGWKQMCSKLIGFLFGKHFPSAYTKMSLHISSVKAKMFLFIFSRKISIIAVVDWLLRNGNNTSRFPLFVLYLLSSISLLHSAFEVCLFVLTCFEVINWVVYPRQPVAILDPWRQEEKNCRWLLDFLLGMWYEGVNTDKRAC